MKSRNRQNGFTLIELMVAGLVMILLGAGLWTLLRSSYNSQWEVMGQNSANTTARQGIDTLVDSIRGATALTAAAASDLTYTDNSGNSIRYWLSGTNLVKTVNGSPNGGTTVIFDVTSFSCTYWSWNGTSWQSSSSPSNLAIVGAASFTVTVVYNGSTRQISGTVQIRQKRLN